MNFTEVILFTGVLGWRELANEDLLIEQLWVLLDGPVLSARLVHLLCEAGFGMMSNVLQQFLLLIIQFRICPNENS